jgi:lipopolysaccharide export system permease protein
MVKFDRDAFDMSKFGKITPNHSAPRERYITELLWPDPNDAAYASNPGQYRVELHERLLGPLYPFAFVALTFAFLGAPRTTRQSRAFSIATAITAVGWVRIAGFACAVLSLQNPAITYFQYVLLAVVLAFSAYIVRNVIILEPPAGLTDSITRLTERLTRRFAPA